MTRSSSTPGPVEAAALPIPADFSLDELRRLHRALVLPRLVEERMLLLLRQGRLSKWFSGVGQEAIAVGVAWALEADDYILPLHRNVGVFTTRGVDLERLFRQLFLREDGFTKGRDRTFHFGALDHRIVGMISHLGAMLPVADGLALAFQLRGERRLAAVFSGDGGTSEGDFHEAMNLAAVWRLPVIFVVENNQWGLSTPISEQYASKDLADRGVGYGMPGVVCDGNDVLAVVRAVREAAARARDGNGPTLIEFKTYRIRGHEEASGVAYVPPDEIALWTARDPVSRFERDLEAWGVVSAADGEALRRELKTTIEKIADAALDAPRPQSTAGSELADVFAPAGPAAAVLETASAEAPERRYIDAISDGLREAMRGSPEVILIGQDIAEYGGAFKVTDGFVAEFGKARVRNTPIIESGAIGAAMGLALEGFRPMVEMQFGDFITCGFNQIVNNLAKTHYRWGAGVPVVIRVPVGGGSGAGPYHSQNVESWFTAVAGLKVVAPATPFDAKGLLLAAFADGNPVLYLEHKFLYRGTAGPVPDGYYTVPIGKAVLAREGSDATVVTYGVGVPWALEAADAMTARGRHIEVVDLRTLAPWDVETVLTSVRKTSRVAILHEAPTTGGFGGEVAATIASEAFGWLDAPVVRVGAIDTPIPAARTLEQIFEPRERLVPALEALLAY